ncbi:arginine deiminase [Paraliomyxa miuraensis]|uniref:arginine deiminase n=1 Tax=Paraliomyxa miuraensis TaxID=376150 RepID=UPI00225371FE|nr:arginine deiminase family protein [Paraliomyxa miuraensis]MCX4247237.1 arginine deiminase family protein [Paraliomyxa miuraensis]
MKIGIDSEIGPLERVLVHRPGEEIVRMTQHELERMLFDDILAPDETVAEHDLMTEIMTEAGASVLRLHDLLVEALLAASASERTALVHRVCEHEGAQGVADHMQAWSAQRLANGLIHGVGWDELEGLPPSLARIRAAAEPHAVRFAVPPLPNLMFMRDPCITIYDRVVVGRMASPARAREAWVVSFALRHAPSARVPLCFESDDSSRAARFRSLEGGDVLVLSPSAVMIGCSQRTTAQTIQRLAEEALFPLHPRLQRVYAVLMPEARSIMHLDTILTQIDRGLFLGHQPLLLGHGGRPGLSVARLERGRPPRACAGASALDALRDELGPDTRLVPCGGDDPLHQEREQWTDGANAVAVGPGHIILYARNTHTIRALAHHGFEEVRVSVSQPALQRRVVIAEGLAKPRAVFSFSGSELSRARGGGRCLTMPLARAALD